MKSSFTLPAATLPASLLAAAAAALLLAAAYPEPGVWILVVPAVMLSLWSVRDRSVAAAAGTGFVTGLLFFLVHVSWTSEFLGPVPWIALSTFMAAWWAAGHALIALLYRRRRGQNTAVTALGVAGLWIARESLASTVPYGGFAWGRIAQSQSAAPSVEWVSWLGFAGLGFVLVAFSALALELCMLPTTSSRPFDEYGKRLRQPLGWPARGAILAALALAIVALPQYPLPQTGSVRVLAVQGDTPGASYFIPSDPGEIMTAHARAMSQAPQQIAPDVILWPEGSVDISPFESTQSSAWLSELAASYGAPILANTVTRTGDWDDPETRYYNTQFVWTADGAGTEQYDKAHPIPFGEYVPDREFYELLAPDLIGMIQREYTPGTRPNVLTVADHRYGVFICYDIVDDRLARDAVNDGAEILLAPTNNADFARTDESAQQLATARLRAVESGRTLVQASTVGWSAAYAPDGSELAALDWYQPGIMVVDAPITTGVTPAIALGPAIELLVGGVGVVCTIMSKPRRHLVDERAPRRRSRRR